MASVVVKVPPQLEPFSLAEMKSHLRVDFADDDALIWSLIRSVRRRIERKYRRAIMTQTLTQNLDYFGQADFTPTWMYSWPVTTNNWGPYGWRTSPAMAIELWPPVQSITAVRYLDPANTLQTMAPAAYNLDAASEPARLLPALNTVWPNTGALPNAVQIDFVAGATTAELVPDDIKEAMRLAIGTYYMNREQTVVGTRLVAIELPAGVDDLMAPYHFPLVY